MLTYTSQRTLSNNDIESDLLEGPDALISQLLQNTRTTFLLEVFCLKDQAVHGNIFFCLGNEAFPPPSPHTHKLCRASEKAAADRMASIILS